VPQVFKLVRDTFRNRLANTATGFNANLAALAVSYDLGVAVFEIDFGVASQNFFEAQVSFDELLDSTPVKGPPVLMLFTTDGNVTNETKFLTFSGIVRISMVLFIGFLSGNALRDMESLGDACVDAMIKTLNDPALSDWSSPLVYNYDIAAVKNPVVFSGENWVQPITFSATCEVHTA